MFDRKEHHKEWEKKKYHRHAKMIRRWKLAKGCAKCGYKQHHVALHIDHIDPDKKSPSIKGRPSLKFNWSIKRIKEELAHCQVLCACCHAIKTFEERK